MAAPHPLSQLPAGYGTLSILICFRLFLGYGRVQLRLHGLGLGQRFKFFDNRFSICFVSVIEDLFTYNSLFP